MDIRKHHTFNQAFSILLTLRQTFMKLDLDMPRCQKHIAQPD